MAFWKTVEYVGLVGFTIAVPRLMGPDAYGSFAAVLGISGFLAIACGLGIQSVFGRFVPEFAVRGDQEGTAAVLMQMLAARLVFSIALAVLWFTVVPRILPEATISVQLKGAGTLIATALGMTFFQFFYGLNRPSRWLVRTSLLRYATVFFLFVLGGMHDFESAVTALLLSEVIFLVLGLAWAGHFLRPPRPSTLAHGRSYLRFGLLFFGANVLLTAIWRSGEIAMLLLGGERRGLAYFNIANAAAIAFNGLIGQGVVALLPSVSTLRSQGDEAAVERWMGFALKYLTLGTVGLTLTVILVADPVVRLTLGTEFVQVGENLRLLMVGLIPVALIRTGVSWSVLEGRPRDTFVMAAGAFATFLASAGILTPRMGATGVATSVVIALGVAGIITAKRFDMRRFVYRARLGTVVGVGGAFIAFLFFSDLPVLAKASITAVGYVGLAVAVLDRNDLQRIKTHVFP